MQVFSLSYPFRLPMQGMPESQVMAIGHFDGVHLGHQEVIRRAVHASGRLAIPASIMTFDPHPREVLGHRQYSRTLTPLRDKLELFRGLGVDYTYVITFNEFFARMEPEHFVDELLMPLHPESVIVGFDFTFGHLGKGTPDTLCELSRGRFAVEVVRPFDLDGGKVSSTLVRNHLLEGRVEEADRLLGRPYALSGLVTRGDARGRTIGFPTANLELTSAYVVPRNGVYAIRAKLEGRSFDGVMNIGVKPTFDGTRQTLEAHLFDFHEDIYGKEVRVELIGFLRDEQKFGSVQELIAQIGRDAEAAKDRLRCGG